MCIRDRYKRVRVSGEWIWQEVEGEIDIEAVEGHFVSGGSSSSWSSSESGEWIEGGEWVVEEGEEISWSEEGEWVVVEGTSSFGEDEDVPPSDERRRKAAKKARKTLRKSVQPVKKTPKKTAKKVLRRNSQAKKAKKLRGSKQVKDRANFDDHQ
eukprot:TRINITY_DN1786_c0_g1_i3.p3 TRINITY_DN1786_c0_g1~~TRINITY_DN1786_c0_g1_i3.p3  ORF type:complete len:154 (-),score=60.00 TRINITY_DN1786_c0_g1_i3:233-694(-)